MPHLVVVGHILPPRAESDQRAEWHNTTFVSNAYVARVRPTIVHAASHDLASNYDRNIILSLI